MASMLALELPACFHPNALQKKYSARSPVGLFALLVMPRSRSWSATFACRDSNSGTDSSERFIFPVLLKAHLGDAALVGCEGQFAHVHAASGIHACTAWMSSFSCSKDETV